MRTLHLLLLTVCVAARAHGQGTVNFANLGAGLNAPIYDYDGVTKLSGPFYVAQLWAGPTANSLQPVSSPVAFTTAYPGYFLGGVHVVPSVAGTERAFFQVRVWADPTRFPTWEALTAAVLSNERDVSWGFNGMDYNNPLGPALYILQTPPLGDDAGLPPNLRALTSFHLVPVPEPTVIALGILCGSALLLRRRRS